MTSLNKKKGRSPPDGNKRERIGRRVKARPIDQLWGICITNPDGPYPKTWMKGYPSANPV